MPVENEILWSGARESAVRSESRDSASCVHYEIRIAGATRRQSSHLPRISHSCTHLHRRRPGSERGDCVRNFPWRPASVGAGRPVANAMPAMSAMEGLTLSLEECHYWRGARQSDDILKLGRSSVRRRRGQRGPGRGCSVRLARVPAARDCARRSSSGTVWSSERQASVMLTPRTSAASGRAS